MGMDSAISKADRHSQKPINDTSDHQHHRLPEAAIEQVQLLAHLTLLVGRRADDEVGRQRLTDLLDPSADGRPEPIDLLAFLHLGRQR